MNNAKRQSGFSVVELMIALVVSLFVILGVLQVFEASFRANSEAIAYTSLNENLRAVTSAMGRDIRRAGFWSGSVLEVKAGTQNNPFTNTVLTFDNEKGDGLDDCIIYGYDRDEDGLTDDATEWRGFRFLDDDDDGVGVIQTKTSGAVGDDDCADGTWADFLDPDVVEITDLTFDFSGDDDWVKVTDDCPTETQTRLYVRTVRIGLTGRLVADPDVERTVQTLVRIRNDRIDTNVAFVGGCT